MRPCCGRHINAGRSIQADGVITERVFLSALVKQSDAVNVAIESLVWI